MSNNDTVTIGGRITRNCRTCHKPFSISTEEAKWLKDKGLEPFTHCSDCRKKRKEQKKTKDESIKI
jgi:hypothetical protein